MLQQRGQSVPVYFRILLALSPAVLLSALTFHRIWTEVINVPYLDEWEQVPMVRHFRDGTLVWDDFWRFHSEHRIIIARVVYLLLIELTNWDRRVILTLNVCGILAVLGMFWLAARRTTSQGLALGLLVPWSLLLLAPAQYENVLFPFPNFVGLTFGAICCVYGFLIPVRRSISSYAAFALAIFGATFASWTLISGLFTWLVFAPLAFRRDWRRGLIWVTTGSTVTIITGQGLIAQANPQTGISTAILGQHPGQAAEYLFVLFGRAIGHPSSPASIISAVIGCVTLLWAVIVLWKSNRPATFWWLFGPWLSLISLGVACCVVIVFGRAYLGPSAGLPARYLAFSALCWLGWFLLVGHACIGTIQKFSTRSITHLATKLSIMAVLTCLIISSLLGWGEAGRYLVRLHEIDTCVINYQTSSDQCLLATFQNAPWFVRMQTHYLHSQGLSYFSSSEGKQIPLPSTPPLASVSLDTAMQLPLRTMTTMLRVDGMGNLSVPVSPLFATQGMPVVLTGWTADAHTFGLASGIVAVIDKKQAYLGETLLYREEASLRYGLEYRNAGYRIVIPTTDLAPGEHEIRLRIIATDASGYYTPPQPIRLIITKP